MTNEFDEFLAQPHTSWTGRTGRSSTAPEGEEEVLDDGRYRAFGFAPGDDLESCNVAWWLTAETPQGQEFLYRYLIRI